MNIKLQGETNYYSVHRTEHGVFLRGKVPVYDMEKLMQMWIEEGFDIIDPGLNDVLEATLVVTSKEKSKIWRDALNVGLENKDWLLSGDTGISSKTIYAVMLGKFTNNTDIPHDPDDFGRCYRLLLRFPEWRKRLPEMIVQFPKWGPMVREWDRMTSIYERDLPSGKSTELFELMQKLVTESYGAI